MTLDQWASLITQGGAVVTLLAFVWLVLTDRIRSRPAHDDEIGLWRDRIADVAADRDEWKAQAKAAIAALDRVGDALEARNRRDEQARRAADK